MYAKKINPNYALNAAKFIIAQLIAREKTGKLIRQTV
jgi:hypothetical protein